MQMQSSGFLVDSLDSLLHGTAFEVYYRTSQCMVMFQCPLDQFERILVKRAFGCCLGCSVRSSANSNSITTFGNSQRRVTDSLIVINAMLFGLQAVSGQKLLLMGAKINSAISQGEWWRLMTAAFLHADILHLGFNCNALHQIGPMVEALSGSARFSVIYLGSAVAGNLASMALSPHMSVGASGAIFGVAASLAVFAYRHRALMGERADFLLKRLSDTAAINFMYGLIIRRIDNWGHLGGLLGGAALTYLLGPRLVAVRPRGTRNVQLVDRPPLPILADRRPERK
ncbi:unnamed protein product [Ostreobium quekettii]|uniref:Peptidase S54 rhomboid domain-containing protein n=1 Tax=Ostreobium quekettii TaxID=121088 RepID=A0A8S1IPH4_9CHLO|nr:unnamed protein product [Ostreobium quekettii]|eukprot:evm.model.scf_60.6 EVM.evm.TU.scf_60.6   scf_60:67069-70139(-)